MQLDNRNKFLILFIFLGALTRFFPPIANFTPLAAMALFGGTYLINKKWAFIIPLTAIFISDIIFEIYNGTGFYPDMIFVYGSMALITCLGFYLRGREQRQTIMVASLTGSIIFFLLTNFGTWTTGYYGYTASGLMNCYVAGIPFFKGTLMGDLFYNIVFFGGFALARRMTPILVKKG
ncbi:MAG: hypothetical protein KA347_02960 [Bacteroidia bacterium]|jgi:hypothetical protein|nr:hypothetical protein [Bacteroidota bacterium]MBP6511613.1 hypothetical protein [Bacteroidia bacterium]MBP7244364.1 hypothetical protein [Bacteroidia bacterium]